MKRTIKTYFKLFIFLFGISLLLVNCEKEQDALKLNNTISIKNVQQIEIESLSQPKFKVSIISNTEINSNKKLIKKLSKTFKTTENLNKEVYSSGHNFTVDTDYAKYIENSDGTYHSYTFKVKREEDNGFLENLLASLQLDGTYKLFLIKYELSGDENFINTTDGVHIEVIQDDEFLENLFSRCELEFQCVEPCIFGYCHTDAQCDNIGALYEIKIVCSGGGGGNPNDPNAGNPVGNEGAGGSGGNTGGGGDTTSPLTCSGGKVLNTTTNQCECPPGKIEDNYGYCRTEEEIALGEINACLTNLDPTLGTWLSNLPPQQSYIILNLNNYLQSNNCSTEAQNFGQLALEAEMNNDIVDYSLEIIIKKKLNDDYPCHANVISEAYGVCSPLTQIILDVFEANDGTNLTFDYGNISGGSAANTYPIFVYNSSTNTCDVNIKFRESYLQSATDISIARTTIHESLHAILVYMYESNMYELPSGTADPTFNDFFEAYTFFVAGTIPTVGLSQNEVQHNYIINFVDDIATSLSNYATGNGYTYSFNYYKTLAWGGLMGTQTFKNLYPKYIDPLDATSNPANINPEHLLIINTIASENTNSIITYPHPNGNTYETQPKGNRPNESTPCN